MTPERWRLIDHLYHDALERDVKQRDAFLKQACGRDADLRHEVESLIASHEHAGNFIAEPALKVTARVLAEDQTASLVGRRFSHYRIDSLLGTGGMGDVYLATDTSLDRKVALKLLPAYFTRDAERLHRFEQEARAASSLNHPNIITIYEIGQVNGLHFIATEFIDGVTLRQHMRSTQISLGEVLDIATQVAAALAAAHGAEILHRDIKPENIMLRRDGYVKVLDFGLAKLTERHASTVEPEARRAHVRTDPGLVLGTLKYMSPEQARRLAIDGRTDIWSLGVVIDEMIKLVTGRVPFTGKTASPAISILEGEPPPLSRDSEVPTKLERIVTKALRKNRDERYQTAHDLGHDLKSLKHELEVEAHLATGRTTKDTVRADAIDVSKDIWPRTRMSKTSRVTRGSSYLYRNVTDHRQRVLIAFGILLGFTGAAFYFWRTPGKPASVSSIKTLAVLPFKPLVAEDRDESLEMGMADTLIARLSNSPEIVVRPLGSVRKYGNLEQDPIAAGRALSVDSVLDGSIQRWGDNIRVNVRLVKVADGASLWTGIFDENFSNVFVVQDAISQKVAAALALQLGGDEQKRLTKRDTENVEAYQSYNKGRFHWNKRTPQDFEKSIQYFKQAVALDPNYARAFAGLADAYALLANTTNAGGSAHEMGQQAREAALKALSLDDNLAEAHAALGQIVVYYDYDFVGAEREHKRAIELNPNYATAHQWYGELLTGLGRHEEALAEMRRALEIDPLSLIINRQYGVSLIFARQYDAGLAQLKKTLELDANFALAHSTMSLAYRLKGNYAASVEELARYQELLGEHPNAVTIRESFAKGGWQGFLRAMSGDRRPANFTPYVVATFHAALAEKDKAFVELNKSYQNREGTLALLRVDPRFDSLHDDPRFQDLVNRFKGASK